jgi:predicted O-methyltransferase YrrM
VIVTPEIEAYTEASSTPEAAHLSHVAAETQRLSRAAGMMVGNVEGGFLATLVAVTGAASVLEIGTFTGYSSISMAAALPPGGHIVTCEVSEEHATIARRHIEASPYADRIEVRLAPALTTIESLPGPFDLVFVDADKAAYDSYYEAVLPKLSERGLIVFDNVLWSGRVLTDEATDEDTVALRALNAKLAADERVEAVMLPVRDGMTLVRHRSTPAS